MTDSSIPFARDPESGPPVSRGRLGALLWIACETMVFAGLVGTFILEEGDQRLATVRVVDASTCLGRATFLGLS